MAAKLKLMPDEEALAKSERSHGRLTDQQVELEVDLRSGEKALADRDLSRSKSRDEVKEAEEYAKKHGWIPRPDGQMDPPKEPEGFFAQGVFKVKQWWATYRGVRDKLDEALAAAERAKAAWNEARGGLDKCKKSLSDTKNEIALWAGTLEDKRKELNRKRAEAADELRQLQTQLDDRLRLWKAEAESGYQADVGKLRQKGESDRASVRMQASTEEKDTYGQREAAMKNSYRWQDDARIRLEKERSELLAKLQKDYETRFKPWQKSETMRRLVGLLHVTTGAYALVLAIRCLIRWLQLRGWCSEQYLVCPP